MTRNEVGVVYDAVLSVHAMNDVVKLDLRMSRKLVLLLSQALEIGLRSAKDEKEPLAFFGQSAVEELRTLMEEGLDKAQLKELYHKLRSFSLRS